MAEAGLLPAGVETRRGHLAMLLFSALIAGSFSLGALVANDIAPTAFNAARFLMAAAAVGVVFALRGGAPRATFRAPWRFLLLGGLFAAYFVAMFEGLKTAPAVSTAAVFTLTPVMSALFGWVLLRQVTTPRIALALAVGALGAVWVIFRADIPAILAFEVGIGERIFFLGCICHAAYTPLVRVLNRGEPVLAFSFATLVACALVLLVWGWGDLRATDWTALRPVVWVAMIYTALAASSITVYLVQFAALRLPSSKVMAYTYLTPSWVILWELALGRAAPPILVLLGLGLTIAALLLLLRE